MKRREKNKSLRSFVLKENKRKRRLKRGRKGKR